MRDFSWRYFESTGEIDAYLLYKACQNLNQDCGAETAEPSFETEMEARTE
ncbi:YqzL-like protein [Tumebacillus sp. BK434]|nr:YqzL family protein [Tumebacillus sp. BK434]TCP53327.1 YqzL-like protein [Tumebacillus sp. BK434]